MWTAFHFGCICLIGIVSATLKNPLRIGVIYDAQMETSGFDLAGEFDGMREAIIHAMCATMKPDDCELIPDISFDVKRYTATEVCRQITSGSRAIISLTTCSVAREIEDLCSQFHIVHMAVPKPICEDHMFTQTMNNNQLEANKVWNSNRLPWLMPNVKHVVGLLRAVQEMQGAARISVFTDGESVIPPVLVTDETGVLLSGLPSAIVSTHLFRMADQVNNETELPEKNAKNFSQYLHWIKDNPIFSHYAVFSLNYNIEDIVRELIINCVMDMDRFWLIVEQADYPPVSVTNLLSQLPNTNRKCSHRRANIGLVRQFPLEFAIRLLENKTANEHDIYAKKLGGSTFGKPERLVLAGFLAFSLGKAYVDLSREELNLTTENPISCFDQPPQPFTYGVQLRELVYNRIVESQLNNVIYFYATHTLDFEDNVEFLLTATYSQQGLQLTDQGRIIAQEVRGSGLFPNLFRGMHGTFLRVGVVVDPPFVQSTRRSQDGELLNVTGMISDIMGLLEERFQFRSKYIESSDGEYGALTNGSWTGLMKDVLEDRIDIAAALLTLTNDRSMYVNYLGPFMISSTAMLGARVGSDENMFKMLNPFQPSVWIAIIASILITGIGLYAINRISPFSAWNLGLPGAIADEVALQENLWSAISSFLLQGSAMFPLALSSRALIALFWTVIVVAHATWQADMTAYMSRTYVKPTISSLADLAYSSEFEPIAVAGSSIFESFDSEDDPIRKAIYHTLKQKENQMHSTEEGVRAVMEYPQLIFIHDRLLLRYAASHACDRVQLLQVQFPETPAGFIVAPGRDFEHAFSQYLSDLQENGSIDRLLSKWWFALSVCKDKEAQYRQMTLTDVLGAVIILAVAIGCSVVALVAEFLYVRWLRPMIQKRKQRKVSNAVTAPEVCIKESSSTSLDQEPSRRASVLLDVLPNPIAKEFRFGGRRRATCAHNASSVNLQAVQGEYKRSFGSFAY